MLDNLKNVYIWEKKKKQDKKCTGAITFSKRKVPIKFFLICWAAIAIVWKKSNCEKINIFPTIKAQQQISNRYYWQSCILPLSLSDLFSCSVSVRVSTELERLDKQELLPDDLPRPPRPHMRMARSGDITAWLSESTSCAVPTENPWWGRPISEQNGRPRRGGGSQIPSWRRLKCWPETETHLNMAICYVNKWLTSYFF